MVEAEKCDFCDLVKEDVILRECIFDREIYGINTMELICDECEASHAGDI